MPSTSLVNRCKDLAAGGCLKHAGFGGRQIAGHKGREPKIDTPSVKAQPRRQIAQTSSSILHDTFEVTLFLSIVQGRLSL